MDQITLNDVAQKDYDKMLPYVLSELHATYPELDLRRGTAIRSLLAEPDAAVCAWFKAITDNTLDSISLKRLLEKEANGEKIDKSALENIMSNFNMAGFSGTRARGDVRMIVKEFTSYSIPVQTVFSTQSGVKFHVTSDMVVMPSDSLIKTDSGLYYFLVPVECDAIGDIGNLPADVALTPDISIYSLISSSSYGPFSGGADPDRVIDVVRRIPIALSSRSVSSEVSSEATLRDRFDTDQNHIIDVSSVGFGHQAQLRDKHNLLSTAIGGRVDLYVRNFTSMHVKTIKVDIKPTIINDKLVATFDVTPDLAPGVQRVLRVVSDMTNGSPTVYPFKSDIIDCGSGSSGHDIYVDNNDHREIFGTMWGGLRLTINFGEHDGSVDTIEPIPIKIDVACLPLLPEMQDFVDHGSVAPSGLDVVVRCPFLVDVFISAIVRVREDSMFNVKSATDGICTYINSLGFVPAITRSEIAAVLIKYGADGVDLHKTDMLGGLIIDAFGEEMYLSGDRLNLDSLRKGGVASPDTAVFVVSPENIHLALVTI